MARKFSGLSDTYTPEPGTVDKAICGYCGSEMYVHRNDSKPASFMSTKRVEIDFFYCPDRETQWHIQLKKLWARYKHEPCSRIAKLYEKEIEEVLRRRVSTRPEVKFYDGIDYF